MSSHSAELHAWRFLVDERWISAVVERYLRERIEGTSGQPVHPSSRIAQPAFQILVMWWILSPWKVMT